jgi:hypothetical protein
LAWGEKREVVSKGSDEEKRVEQRHRRERERERERERMEM